MVDPRGLAARAAEVAARQRSPETRRTYAAVYRAFAGFLGLSAVAADLTPAAVRAYRDGLEQAGRSPATVAKHLSALRGLEPRALTHDEFARLLRMPDRRTRQGKRDLALVHLLGSAGLRHAEATNLLVADIDERRRTADPRPRQANRPLDELVGDRPLRQAPSRSTRTRSRRSPPGSRRGRPRPASTCCCRYRAPASRRAR